MALQTATGTAQCPECFAEVTLTNVMRTRLLSVRGAAPSSKWCRSSR